MDPTSLAIKDMEAREKQAEQLVEINQRLARIEQALIIPVMGTGPEPDAATKAAPPIHPAVKETTPGKKAKASE